MASFSDLNDPQSKITALKTTLANLEEAIEGRISENVNSFSINGKTIEKMTIPEMTELHKFYTGKLKTQQNKQDQLDGKAMGKIKTKFIESN